MIKHIFHILIFLVIFFEVFSALPVQAEDVDIHGFLAQGYLKTDKNNFLADTEDGSFEFNELGINFVTGVTDRLRIGIQFFARDIGDLGNDEIVLDWGYGDYLWREWLGFRAGLIKIPHGLYNETRDMEMFRNSILLPQGIYNESWRDSFVSSKGVGIYGNILQHIKYQFQVGILRADIDGGMAKSAQHVIIIDQIGGDSGDPAIIGNLQLYDLLVEGLKLNGSYMNWKFGFGGTLVPSVFVPFAAYTHTDGEGKVWTMGFEYIYENLTIASEYASFEFSLPSVTDISDFVPAGSPGTIATDNFSTEMEGYYASVAYRFSDWLEVGAYYSVFYYDKDDRDGKKYETAGLGNDFERWMKDGCLTFRFDINDNWIAKLEGHVVNGTGVVFIVDNLDENGDHDMEEDWMLYAAKVIYHF